MYIVCFEHEWHSKCPETAFWIRFSTNESRIQLSKFRIKLRSSGWRENIVRGFARGRITQFGGGEKKTR